nr:uncharacterized protein LOC104100670 [Nicotiana tomentosiformis]
MDVYNTFLQGDLCEEVYVEMPEGSNETLIDEAKHVLHQKFKLKDLGELNGAKTVVTPLVTNLKLTITQFDDSTGVKDDAILRDDGLHQRLIGQLMCVITTRPDISYAIQTLSQFMQ